MKRILSFLLCLAVMLGTVSTAFAYDYKNESDLARFRVSDGIDKTRNWLYVYPKPNSGSNAVTNYQVGTEVKLIEWNVAGSDNYCRILGPDNKTGYVVKRCLEPLDLWKVQGTDTLTMYAQPSTQSAVIATYYSNDLLYMYIWNISENSAFCYVMGQNQVLGYVQKQFLAPAQTQSIVSNSNNSTAKTTNSESTQTRSTNNNNKTWADAYYSFLTDLNNDPAAYKGMSGVLKIALYDMNRDGVPELLIQNNGIIETMGQTANIYTYLNGKVEKTKEYVGPMPYYYPNSTKYPGLFWRSGELMFGQYCYVYLDSSGNTHREIIEKFDYDEIVKVTRDDDLYNFFKSSSSPQDKILEFTEFSASNWAGMLKPWNLSITSYSDAAGSGSGSSSSANNGYNTSGYSNGSSSNSGRDYGNQNVNSYNNADLPVYIANSSATIRGVYYAYMYEKPSSSSKTVDTYQNGTEIKVIDYDAHEKYAYCIGPNNKRGYIQKSWLIFKSNGSAASVSETSSGNSGFYQSQSAGNNNTSVTNASATPNMTASAEEAIGNKPVFTGGFNMPAVTLTIGDVWYVESSVTVSGGSGYLGNVEIACASNSGSFSANFSGMMTSYAETAAYTNYLLDTNVYPWNVPGTYTLTLNAQDSNGDGYSFAIDTMTLTIKAKDSGSGTGHSSTVQAGIGIPTFSGSFAQSSKTLTVGDQWYIDSSVSVSGGSGYLGNVEIACASNSQSFSANFSGMMTSYAETAAYTNYLLDTNVYPWNVPGTYTLTLNAQDSDGNGFSFAIDTMTLTIKAKDSGSGTGHSTNQTSSKLSAPSRINIDAVTNSAVSVSFNSVSGAKGYYLYYSTSNSFSTSNSKVQADAGKQVGYVDGLSSGKQYYFWVAAYDSNGNIGYESSVATTITGSVSLSLSNQSSGMGYYNKQTYDFNLSDALNLVWDVSSGNGTIEVKSFVMNKETQFDANDANYAVKYLYDVSGGISIFTASDLRQWQGAVPFGFSDCSSGQYVKVWVGARDKNYNMNGVVVGVQFALKLTSGTSSSASTNTVTQNNIRTKPEFLSSPVVSGGTYDGDTYNVTFSTSSNVSYVVVCYKEGGKVKEKDERFYASRYTNTYGLKMEWSFQYQFQYTNNSDTRNVILRCYDSNGNYDEIVSFDFTCKAKTTQTQSAVKPIINEAKADVVGTDNSGNGTIILTITYTYTDEITVQLLKDSVPVMIKDDWTYDTKRVYNYSDFAKPAGGLYSSTKETQKLAPITVPKDTEPGKYTLRITVTNRHNMRDDFDINLIVIEAAHDVVSNRQNKDMLFMHSNTGDGKANGDFGNAVACHDYNNCPTGTIIYAPYAGTYTAQQRYRTYNGVQKLTSYGNCIIFTSSDGMVRMLMGHMNSFKEVDLKIPSTRTEIAKGSENKHILLENKDVVKGGELGTSGNTGNSKGPHIHFEIQVKINGKLTRVYPCAFFHGKLIPCNDSNYKDPCYSSDKQY